MVSAKLKNLFAARLTAIKNNLNNRYNKGPVYVIQVPDDMQWWYYQEYGTATRGEPGRASGVAYDIVPTKGLYLKIPSGGGKYIYTKVIYDHPGIPPSYSITKILPDLEKYTKEQLQSYSILHNPAKLESIIKNIAEKAKELITKSFEANLPGSRQDGKLEGKTAAQEFNERATVVKK